MTRQKYDTVLFVQRFLRCKLSGAISFFFGVSYQKQAKT